jgi:cytochrome P450
VSLYTTFDHYDPPIGPDGTPYDYYEALRDEAIENDRPIGWSEVYGGFWVVAGWPEAREIQRNLEAFSNVDVTFPSYATPGDRPLIPTGYDGEQHAKLRKFLQPQFSPGKAEALGDSMRPVVNELIDKFIDKGRVDLVEVFTAEVPARLTALVGGLPAEDTPIYQKWVHAAVQLARTDPAACEEAFADLQEYFEAHIDDWRTREGDDYTTMVAQTVLENGERADDDTVRDLFLGLLMGGIDNTMHLMGTMLWRMAWDRELRRRLVRKPEMLPVAIDEFLRFYSPGLVCRTVIEPIEIGGVKMEPGQHVVLVHPLENRDPREFPYPDVFIPERAPNRHFALGLGVHRCLGMHILRVEARVAMEEFFKRIPEWELDPERRPRWYAGQVGGMASVPAVFPPGGGYPDADWVPGRPLALA